MTSTVREKLPNLAIAGVVKGGTTSVYSYLSMHPEICCSSVKETCYFSRYRYGQWDSRYRHARDPHQQYRQYFQHYQGQKYILEATPGYFEGGTRVAKAIWKTLGSEVKIIIVLRDPIDRLLSFFKYKKSMMEIDKKLSLDVYIQQCNELPFLEKAKQENDMYWGIEGGFYANYLPDWFEVFDKNIKVVFFDELKTDSKSLLENLCQWLEIDATVYRKAELGVENKSVAYKNRAIQQLALAINTRLESFWRSHPKLKANLRDFYYIVNGSSHRETMTVETRRYLESVYSFSNRQLREQLESRGYTNLPAWIAKA